MKKKTWMKYIAGCLTLALFVTMVPMQAAANTENREEPVPREQLAEVLLRLRRRLQLQQQVRPQLQQPTVNPTLYELECADSDGKRWFKPSYAFVEQGDRSEWLLYLFS